MKIAALIFDKITVLDIVGPTELLSWVPGAEIVWVGKEIGPIRAAPTGLALNVEHTLEEVPSADVLIIPGARGKHIDPSVRAWSLGKGGLPTTAKLGIDATIPEGVPKDQYERIRYFAKDAVRLEDYL